MDFSPASLGRYELRAVIARSSASTVYEGWDAGIARKVAIKTVALPDAADLELQEKLGRFRREAQAAGRLQHPNIVGVYDYGETPDVAYIVMEFVDGPTLKALFDRGERFALPDVLRIMQDVLAGLQYSHNRGIVHRDVKPANIMLASDGRAKIADFGIARIESSSMTQIGTVLGTPSYMSPEQFVGEVVDLRTDIYSAGVVLYQMLTGERPYEGGLTTIMHKVLNTEPPKPSQLSPLATPSMDAVVAKAMAKHRDQRYPSAEALSRALREAADATVVARRPLVVPPEEPRLRPPERSPGSGRRRSARSTTVVAAGVLVLLLAGGATWFTRFAAQPSNTGPDFVPPPPSAPSRPTGQASVPPIQAGPPVPAAEPVRTASLPGAPALPAPPSPASEPVPTASVPPEPQAQPAPAPLTAATEERPPAALAPAARASDDSNFAAVETLLTNLAKRSEPASVSPQAPEKPVQMVAEGRPGRNWTGMRVESVSAEAAKQVGEVGLMITRVEAGSAAARADLRPKDIVLTFNQKPVETVGAFNRAIARTRAGEPASIDVWRDGQLVSVQLVR